MELKKTVERIVPKKFETREEYLLYLRHLFAYQEAVEMLQPNHQILDIGFGEGYGVKLISEHISTVTGLDVNKDAVAYANKKYASENCFFEVYDGKKLPYEDKTYDAVISFQVIEHIKDDLHYLEEIRRVLKPGGQAILTTPNRETRLEPGQEPWNDFHVREYSAKQLNELLDNVFPTVSVYGIRGDETVEKVESNRIERRLSFYKLLPHFMKRWVTGDFMEKFDTDRFYLTDRNISESMDLYIIAQR